MLKRQKNTISAFSFAYTTFIDHIDIPHFVSQILE